jgi:hypothetical protein
VRCDARHAAGHKQGQGGGRGISVGGAQKTPPEEEKTLEDYGIDTALAKQARKAGALTPDQLAQEDFSLVETVD